MFFPTVQEILLLHIIAAKPLVTKKELEAMNEFQGKEQAFEGCIVKKYIEMDEWGHLRVTQAGTVCI